MAKQILHPLVPNMLLHSCFGRGPDESSVYKLKYRNFKTKNGNFGVPMRCSLRDSKDLQCLWQREQVGS